LVAKGSCPVQVSFLAFLRDALRIVCYYGIVARVFRAQRITSAVDDSPMWVVVDDYYEVHKVARDFCLTLAGAGRSPNTVRTYAPKVARFLTWCSVSGLDWTRLTFRDLSRYKRCIEMESTVVGRRRDGKTVNLYLGVMVEFLRFAVIEGHVDAALVEKLSRPKYLRDVPKGLDPGENGQNRIVAARTLKANEYDKLPEALEPGQVCAVLDACRNPRDVLLIRVLHDIGLRIGEALGLRRSDIHFLPDSSVLGCAVKGPHLHVRRRMNPNGSLAKSRYPRHVPVTAALVDAYRDYQGERYDRLSEGQCDFVFVNLYGREPDAPMTYANAKRCTDRIGKTAEVALRPHMLRHTAATNWVRNGERLDVVQELLGHVSWTSTQVYLHPCEEEMRNAVDALALGKEIAP
jgi:integrase/recombinase XerD